MQYLAIFGVPRSGTSWLGQLFNSSSHVAYRYQPLFSYAFKNRLDEHSEVEDIKAFHEDLLKTDDEFVLQKQNISGNETPEFEKSEITHLVWKEVRYLHIIENLLLQSDIKIIGLVRHPCAVIYSWYNAPREFDPDWNVMKEWKSAPKKNRGRKEEFFGYEKWKEATQSFIQFQKQFPESFYLQVYEDLTAYPKRELKKLFKFSNLPFDKQTANFVDRSTQIQSRDPYDVFRKGKTGYEWIGKLDEQIVNYILKDDDFIRIAGKIGWKTPGKE